MELKKRAIQRTIYIVTLTAIAVFLFWLGPKPWIHVLEHWKVFLTVMGISTAGIIVQAYSYRSVAPTAANIPPPLELIRIWSMSGALSVVLPVFAGFGTRTALLVQKGMPLTASLLTSARQAWMGLEYALIIGAGSAFFIDYTGKIWLVCSLALGWLYMTLFRSYAHISHKKVNDADQNWFQRLRSALSAPVSLEAQLWLPVQVLLMGLIYYIAFYGFGASVDWAGALLLASITVLASLVILVPNGMGVMDAIWVMVGMHSNLQLAQSVAFALTLRLSYLAAASLVWLVASGCIRTMQSRHG